MNTTSRFLYGILSSLFLAVGFQRLAARFDPLSHQHVVNAGISGAAADTGTLCWGEVQET